MSKYISKSMSKSMSKYISKYISKSFLKNDTIFKTETKTNGCYIECKDQKIQCSTFEEACEISVGLFDRNDTPVVIRVKQKKFYIFKVLLDSFFINIYNYYVTEHSSTYDSLNMLLSIGRKQTTFETNILDTNKGITGGSLIILVKINGYIIN